MSVDPREEEVRELRRQLLEAEETLRAIRSGEVDALVVDDGSGDRIFTLRGAEQPYRVLVESMQQGAATLDVDGNILYCNHCFWEMVGTPQEKVIGAAISDFVRSDHRPMLDRLLAEGRVRVSRCELPLRPAEDEPLFALLVVAPLRLGDVEALSLVATDLTERKQHDDLRETSRRKDEFLAMLAHELRNPLAPVRNAAAILQRLDVADERVTHAAQMIERQIRHLSRLVDDLLDVSRISMGKVELQRRVLDIGDLLSRVAEPMRAAMTARGHALTLLLPEGGLPVHGDAVRLEQVFGNLLGNAVKFTEPGGEIGLSAWRDGATVVISVKDSGVGIPPDLLPRIFDLFVQGKTSLAGPVGGLGIGLTLVRRLVELHGGNVVARSDGPRRGSEFIVRLPLCTEISDRIPARTDPLDPAGDVQRPRRVLVVDDHQDGAETLGRLLQLMGHQVLIAGSAAEALRAIGTFVPQIVLLDIGLPDMSGYEVARRLREQPDLRSLTLIGLSGYGRDEDIQRAREAGFDRYLVKPVDPAQLRRVLVSREEGAC